MKIFISHSLSVRLRWRLGCGITLRVSVRFPDHRMLHRQGDVYGDRRDFDNLSSILDQEANRIVAQQGIAANHRGRNVRDDVFFVHDVLPLGPRRFELGRGIVHIENPQLTRSTAV